MDSVTGEIRDDIIIMTREQRNAIRETRERQRQAYYRYRTNRFNYGNFFWLFYKAGEPLYNNISGATLVRLFFLGTFISYSDSALQFDNGQSITMNNVCKLLRISERQFQRMRRETKGILEIKNGRLHLNTACFFKGRICGSLQAETQIICVYADAVRYLYNNVEVSQHKKLSYLFRLIPYTNKQWNNVCTDITQASTKKVGSISLSAFACLIQYDRRNITKLKKYLESVILDDDGKKAIYFEQHKQQKIWKIIINPALFCKSDNPLAIEQLAQFTA